MAGEIFGLKAWGPPKLRERLEVLQKEIIERTPLESESIELSQETDGRRIYVRGATQGGSAVGDSAGGGGGTNVDIYGARNGAAAIFHLLQTSPPTSAPP